jgi:hypothetical protein
MLYGSNIATPPFRRGGGGMLCGFGEGLAQPAGILRISGLLAAICPSGFFLAKSIGLQAFFQSATVW